MFVLLQSESMRCPAPFEPRPCAPNPCLGALRDSFVLNVGCREILNCISSYLITRRIGREENEDRKGKETFRKN